MLTIFPAPPLYVVITILSTKHAYALPAAKIDDGIFNGNFSEAKLWNSLDIEIKSLSIKLFKRVLNKNHCQLIKSIVIKINFAFSRFRSSFIVIILFYFVYLFLI